MCRRCSHDEREIREEEDFRELQRMLTEAREELLFEEEDRNPGLVEIEKIIH